VIPPFPHIGAPPGVQLAAANEIVGASQPPGAVDSLADRKQV
jgi:hypothetical protein